MSSDDTDRTPNDALPRTAEDSARERRAIDELFEQVPHWRKELKVDEPVVLSDEYLELVERWAQQAFNAEGARKAWVFRHDAEFKRYFQMVRESNHR